MGEARKYVSLAQRSFSPVPYYIYKESFHIFTKGSAWTRIYGIGNLMAICIFAPQKIIPTLTSCTKSVYSHICEKILVFRTKTRYSYNCFTSVKYFICNNQLKGNFFNCLIVSRLNYCINLTINHSLFEKTINYACTKRQLPLLFYVHFQVFLALRRQNQPWKQL